MHVRLPGAAKAGETRYHLLVNLKTAKALALTIAPSVLLRADQLIE
jgi:hypothetical protein